MSDGITPEEIKAGTQPTRLEKIAFTPLEVVLAKSSWDDVDVEILVANRHKLDAATKEKLGLTKPKPLTPEEVQQQTDALGDVPEEKTPEQIAAETATVVAPQPAPTGEGTPTPVGVEATQTVDNKPAQ